MKIDNQSKGKDYYKEIQKLLSSSIEDGSIELENGQISRTWIRSKIGCGQNWPNQNVLAVKLIKSYEDQFNLEIKQSQKKSPPRVNDKDMRLIMARADRLEQKNAYLVYENIKFKEKLNELGWLDCDEEEAQQGKLPW